MIPPLFKTDLIVSKKHHVNGTGILLTWFLVLSAVAATHRSVVIGGCGINKTTAVAAAQLAEWQILIHLFPQFILEWQEC